MSIIAAYSAVCGIQLTSNCLSLSSCTDTRHSTHPPLPCTVTNSTSSTMATSVPCTLAPHPRTQPPSIPDPPPVNIVQPVHPCTLPPQTKKTIRASQQHYSRTFPFEPAAPLLLPPSTPSHSLPLPPPCSFPSKIQKYKNTKITNTLRRTSYKIRTQSERPHLISTPSRRTFHMTPNILEYHPTNPIPSPPLPIQPSQAARQRQDRAKV